MLITGHGKQSIPSHQSQYMAKETGLVNVIRVYDRMKS
jgi:hypothetical protein